MKYIFLDIDGVLNNDRTKCLSPDGFIGISSGLVKKLKEIVLRTNAEIILTSTWKISNDKDFKYLTKRLMQSDLFLSGKTKEPYNHLSLRGRGIKDFLEQHECEEFVILDDELFDFGVEGLLEHVVMTDYREGLTKNDIEKAVQVLNGIYVDPKEYREFVSWGYHH